MHAVSCRYSHVYLILHGNENKRFNKINKLANKRLNAISFQARTTAGVVNPEISLTYS